MKVLLTATVQSHICQFHKPLVEVLHAHGCEVHVEIRWSAEEPGTVTAEEMSAPAGEMPAPAEEIPFQAGDTSNPDGGTHVPADGVPFHAEETGVVFEKEGSTQMSTNGGFVTPSDLINNGSMTGIANNGYYNGI